MKRNKPESDIGQLARENAGKNRTDTVEMFKKLLDDYHWLVANAIADGYDGTLHSAEDQHYSWSYASAVLFTASILTTIGQSISQFLCWFDDKL